VIENSASNPLLDVSIASFHPSRLGVLDVDDLKVSAAASDASAATYSSAAENQTQSQKAVAKVKAQTAGSQSASTEDSAFNEALVQLGVDMPAPPFACSRADTVNAATAAGSALFDPIRSQGAALPFLCASDICSATSSASDAPGVAHPTAQGIPEQDLVPRESNARVVAVASSASSRAGSNTGVAAHKSDQDQSRVGSGRPEINADFAATAQQNAAFAANVAATAAANLAVPLTKAQKAAAKVQVKRANLRSASAENPYSAVAVGSVNIPSATAVDFAATNGGSSRRIVSAGAESSSICASDVVSAMSMPSANSGSAALPVQPIPDCDWVPRESNAFFVAAAASVNVAAVTYVSAASLSAASASAAAANVAGVATNLSPPVPPCELCDDFHASVCFCTVCEQYMCAVGRTAHQKAKISKNHLLCDSRDVVPGLVASPAAVAAAAASQDAALLTEAPGAQRPTFCPQHPRQVLELFCETCQSSLCRVCMSTPVACRCQLAERGAAAVRQVRAVEAAIRVLEATLGQVEANGAVAKRNTNHACDQVCCSSTAPSTFRWLYISVCLFVCFPLRSSFFRCFRFLCDIFFGCTAGS
jgi:hypothetical protein